jgi:hypothetical protein
MFEIHNAIHNFYFINKLLSIKMEETTSMIYFLIQIKEITTQLANIGKTLEGSKIVYIMFNHH